MYIIFPECIKAMKSGLSRLSRHTMSKRDDDACMMALYVMQTQFQEMIV